MQVFISYSRVDKAFVQTLTEALEDLGIEYFRDEKDIEWGRNVSDAISEALRNCSSVLVVISPASLRSPWVPFEVGQAMALQKEVLPLVTHPSLELPSYLASLNYKTGFDDVIEYFKTLSQSLPKRENLEAIHKLLREDTSVSGAQRIEWIRQIAEGPSKAARKHLEEIAGDPEFYAAAETAAALAALKNIAEKRSNFDLLNTVKALDPSNKLQDGGPASLVASMMFWERRGSEFHDKAFDALMRMLKGPESEQPES